MRELNSNEDFPFTNHLRRRTTTITRRKSGNSPSFNRRFLRQHLSTGCFLFPHPLRAMIGKENFSGPRLTFELAL
jgi:hypothetical protein